MGRGIFGRRKLADVDRGSGREVDDELKFHLEQRVRDYVARGMDPEAARRAALERLGDLERVRDACTATLEAERRAESRRGRVVMSWLDVKLGLRMLVKYPGLTLIGGLGMAVAIAIGAGFFDVAAVVHSTLPFEEGERIVAIENWDTEWRNQERRIVHDFEVWREELKTVEQLGAYRTIGRNLIVPGGETELVYAAEMTASGFALARVPALLGRFLTEDDERDAAPPVVVIGYDVWRTRFASDPGVVGREVRLGGTVHTVVGVMPEGFAFPISHQFWIPFRANASDYERREGPGIYVFGRLAPGATLEGTQTELTTIAQRMAAAFPETHERLRPRVVPYTRQLYDDMQGWEIPVLQALIVMLLVIVCVNVAILVYARTATRQGEIAVRTAIGASRRRVVAQLFAESLVFTSASAVVGLFVARIVLRFVEDALEPALPQGLPFWIEFRLSAGTILYVLALTVLSASIVGVLPALQATGRRVQTSLQRLGTKASGMQLGSTWSTLVVVQVAFAVAVLPGAAFYAWHLMRFGVAEPGHRTDEFLTARLSLERDEPWSAAADAIDRAFESRFVTLQTALVTRLRAEPAISDVLLTLGPPGEEGTVWVEVEGLPAPARASDAVQEGTAGHALGTSRIALDFFDAFDIPVIAGRLFNAGDLGAGANAVIANRSFVQDILNGANALGRRVRYVGRSGDVDQRDAEFGAWYEIVGVVEDFPNHLDPSMTAAKLYHPVGPEVAYAMINVRVRGADPTTFASRLREITADVDPRLQLRQIRPLDLVMREEQRAMQLGALGIALVTLSVLLLCAAGIYALMSFAVTRRQREIGIRAALGAHPRRILAAVFSRAATQLAIGVGVGLAAAALLDMLTEGELLGGQPAVFLFGVSVFMMLVGLLAALGPALRGLRIQPSAVLREE
jgi:predicted permease